VLLGQLLEFAQGDALAAAGHFGARFRENRVKTLAKRMQAGSPLFQV
jgi:hypothetical protein